MGLKCALVAGIKEKLELGAFENSRIKVMGKKNIYTFFFKTRIATNFMSILVMLSLKTFFFFFKGTNVPD